MKRFHHRLPDARRVLSAIAVAAAFLLPLALSDNVAAQGAAARASQFYEDALKRYEAQDYAGAVVQLKNVLQLDTRNLSAQVLLGRALLADSQVNAAEVALQEALRLGADRAEVAVPLAEVAIRQGLPGRVLDEPLFAVEGLPRDVRHAMLLLRSSAATDLGDAPVALKAIAEARALKPDDPAADRAEVPVRIRMRQFKEAVAAADRALALAPNDADSHFQRGEALHVAPDLRRAREAYDRALALNPEHVGALIARAGALLDLGLTAEAARDVDAALAQNRNEARAHFLKAVIAERAGRTSEARAAYNEVTSLIDPIPPGFLRYRPQFLMLGGMAHNALGQGEKAKPYLEGVLRDQPAHPVAKVLANLHVADGNADAAAAVIEGYLRSNPRDWQAQMLLANAHLNRGRPARAVQVVQDALKQGDRLELRGLLGLALAAAGRSDEAIRELERAHARDPRWLDAAYTLGSLYVRAGRAQDALKVARSLAASHPGSGHAQLLLGKAQALDGNTAAARTALRAALAASPELLDAHVALAQVELRHGQPALAAQELDAVFRKNDKHADAIAMMAALSESAGRLDEAERWFARGSEVAPQGQVGPVIARVEFHLRHGQVDKARAALGQAQGRAPDALATLVAAGRVALAAGDRAAARTALGRAATAAGYRVPQLTQIAALQREAGADDAAAHSLDKALKERPDDVPALALRAEIDIARGDHAAAEGRIRKVQALWPKRGVGWTLAGSLALARQQDDMALAAFRRANELDGDTQSFLRLFAASLRRDLKQGLRLGEQWVARHPRDAVAIRALADTQFNAGNLEAAREGYERLRALGVRDANALNNLAHVLLRLGQPGAQAAADQALALAPELPHVIGTAGWAAHRAGQNDRALQLLRDARVRNPTSADTRYYLAAVLAATGRGAEARTELQAALAADSGLSHRAEAEALMQSLR